MSSHGLPNCPSDTQAAQCTAELPQAIAELLALTFFFCLLRAFGSACSLTKSIQGKIRVEASSCIKATERKRPKTTCSSVAIVREEEFSLYIKNTIIVHWGTQCGALYLCRAHRYSFWAHQKPFGNTCNPHVPHFPISWLKLRFPFSNACPVSLRSNFG